MEKKILNLNGTVLRNTEDVWDKDGGRTWSLISVRDGGYLTVKGGEFDVVQLDPTHKDKRFMLNCFDANYKAGKSKIIVTGGKFHDFDPGNNLAEGPGTNFLAPGYKSVEVEEGVFEVVPEN